jgi:hypothetical protein
MFFMNVSFITKVQERLAASQTDRSVFMRSHSPHRWTVPRLKFQALVVTEPINVVIHFLIVIRVPSFPHFLTTPDEASNSERTVVNAATCDGLDNFWPNDRAIVVLLLVLCVQLSG